VMVDFCAILIAWYFIAYIVLMCHSLTTVMVVNDIA